MVCNYKPVGTKNRRKCYTIESMQAALEAVSRGESLSKVAAQYGIPISTLKDKRSGVHPFKLGGQIALSVAEEEAIAHNCATLADWGFPLEKLDVRMLVQSYLDKRKKNIAQFVNNTPGDDWVRAFLKRNHHIICDRVCRNISRKRGFLSAKHVKKYFHNLEATIKDVPATHIINFDETNLSDDPGKKRCVVRRRCKYPERIMNSTKSSTSVMFAAAANGNLLNPYVVYRAEYLHDRWIMGGPTNARYNRSRSGWFDSKCFSDWFSTVLVPYCRKLPPGKRIIIGDNLSSHFTMDVIAQCADLNIHFVCLPANTTHLCQPLDVACFSSLKRHWRQILTKWKQQDGARLPALPKEAFPKLLGNLLEALKPEQKKNVMSGFRKCGIIPFNAQIVLKRILHSSDDVAAENVAINQSVSAVVLNTLSEIHRSNAIPASQRKKRLNVEPGKSISLSDFTEVRNSALSTAAGQDLRDDDSNDREVQNDDDNTDEEEMVFDKVL